MNERTHACAVDDIAAYIDGELEASREMQLEMHFVACSRCTAELNDQKQFLQSLDASLRDESEVQLPPDFTRHVVARAESSVSGVRRPAEFFNAVFICVAMALFVLFAAGADAGRIFSFAEPVAAVAAFFGHLVYSFFVGVAIIVRATASQLDGGASTAVLLSLAIGAFSLYVSRKALTARGI